MDDSLFIDFMHECLHEIRDRIIDLTDIVDGYKDYETAKAAEALKESIAAGASPAKTGEKTGRGGETSLVKSSDRDSKVNESVSTSHGASPSTSKVGKSSMGSSLKGREGRDEEKDGGQSSSALGVSGNH